MTNFEYSTNFCKGLVIIAAHTTYEFSLGVMEESAIYVNGLCSFSKEDIAQLEALGWEAGNKDGGWAQYFKLEYVDT